MDTGQPLHALTILFPPFCSVCNVNCTSKDTLMSHAAGVKHKRRARAASAAANGGQQQPQNAAPSQSEPSETPAQQTPEPTQPIAPASNDQDGSNKKRPAKDSDSDSSSSSDSDSDSDAADKKKQKKGKADGSHPALSDASALAAFIKASKKKIAKKGKLGGKLLQKLAAKKLGSKEADEQLLKALREKVCDDDIYGFQSMFVDVHVLLFFMLVVAMCIVRRHLHPDQFQSPFIIIAAMPLSWPAQHTHVGHSQRLPPCTHDLHGPGLKITPRGLPAYLDRHSGSQDAVLLSHTLATAQGARAARYALPAVHPPLSLALYVLALP